MCWSYRTGSTTAKSYFIGLNASIVMGLFIPVPLFVCRTYLIFDCSPLTTLDMTGVYRLYPDYILTL